MYAEGGTRGAAEWAGNRMLYFAPFAGDVAARRQGTAGMDGAIVDRDALRATIKEVIVESLRLDGVEPAGIEDEAPLFGEGLGLDSVDALELVVALEKKFQIKIQSKDVGKDAFYSVATLADLVASRLAAQA